jgi:hypothetical protein
MALSRRDRKSQRQAAWLSLSSRNLGTTIAAAAIRMALARSFHDDTHYSEQKTKLLVEDRGSNLDSSQV